MTITATNLKDALAAIEAVNDTGFTLSELLSLTYAFDAVIDSENTAYAVDSLAEETQNAKDNNDQYILDDAVAILKDFALMSAIVTEIESV